MDVVLTQFGNEIGDNVYLPYAIGCIVSYCKSKLKGVNYNMLYIKKDIGTILDEIGTPDVLAMSSYIWNHQYNLKIAKLVKQKSHKTIIVFGGHEINGFDKNVFERHPFIDVIVNGEGEYTFYRLLKTYLSVNESFYYNHTVNFNNGILTMQQKNNFIDINDIPSPYLTGVFDEIMKDKYNFTASLETNRGCPYQCFYCDWGNHKTTNKTMRKFDIDRVNKEIEWFGKNKIDFVFGCDSNFGIIDRDMDIIDKIIATKKEYGYPKKFRVCYAKNSNKLVFDMNKKLNEYELSKGATISFQSLNEETNKAIGRKNISIEDFNYYMQMYNSEKIPVYTEMIIGLPEETYDSFKEGFDILLNNHQHSNIVVYYCQILTNSKFGEKEYQEKYGIKTSRIPMYPTHTKFVENQIFEYEEIVVATNTMDKFRWIKICMFSWCVQTFHCLGLTRYVAIHFKYVYGIDYQDFYQSLLDFCCSNDVNLIKKEYFMIAHIFMDIALNKEDKGFKYIKEDLNWTLEEGSFIHFSENFDLFYLEIVEFLFSKYPKIAMNKEIVELVKFNKHMLSKYNDKKFHIKINHDFLETFKRYFKTGEYVLEHYPNTTYIPATKKYKSLKDYAVNVVWYGRKGGNTLKDFDDIKVEYIKDDKK